MDWPPECACQAVSLVVQTYVPTCAAPPSAAFPNKKRHRLSDGRVALVGPKLSRKVEQFRKGVFYHSTILPVPDARPTSTAVLSAAPST